MNKIKDKNKIEVFYNDSCPVCKREIEIYKSRSEGVEYNDSSETVSYTHLTLPTKA